MEQEASLKSIWQLYEKKQCGDFFYDYLKKLQQFYLHDDKRSPSESENSSGTEGPHLSQLPDDLLPVLGKELFSLQEKIQVSIERCSLEKATAILRSLLVICRNFDNIPFVASCDFVGDIIALASRIVAVEMEVEVTKEAAGLLHQVFSFFECMYDPYCMWRNSLSGQVINSHSMSFQPAILHTELIPFFYDCFQNRRNCWSEETFLHCIHMFGAVLSGAKHNAVKMICPATVEILYRIVNDSQYSLEVKCLVLQCLVKTVENFQQSNPAEEQVDLSSILSEYHRSLIRLSNEDLLTQNLSLILAMLDKLKMVLSALDRDVSNTPSMHPSWAVLLLRMLTIHKLNLLPNDAHTLLQAVFEVMGVLLRVAPFIKTKICYNRLADLVAHFLPLPDAILESMLELVSKGDEADFDYTRVVRNPEMIGVILSLLPFLSEHQQETIVDHLLPLCCQHLQSRMTCCQAKIIDGLLMILNNSVSLSAHVAVTLMEILKHLGRDSISSQQVKSLLSVLKPSKEQWYEYTSFLIQALSGMAKREGYEGASHFWDFQESLHGITVPTIRRIPGSGFTFHIWLRLDALRRAPGSSDPSSNLYRRQLYSFYTSSGTGFEAFFLPDGILVVAVCIKKEYFTLSIMDTPLDDGLWHSVTVCHISARRPFTNSQVTIYVDGRLKASAQLKCPSLSEPFTYCRIGSPGPKTNVRGSAEDASLLSASERILSNLPAFFSLPTTLRSNSYQDPLVKVVAVGMQDKLWGPQRCFHGQMSSITLFSEALQPSQIKTLYSAGAESFDVTGGEESEANDIASKMVFCYHAKACQRTVCLDLSPGSVYEGRVTAPRYFMQDVRDSINCVGGVFALFPILSLVDDTSVIVSTPPSLSRQMSSVDEGDDWIVLPSSRYSDTTLQTSLVAGFLVTLRNFIKNHTLNQEHLLQKQGISILAYLLQEVPDAAINVHVLIAVQSLVECLGVSGMSERSMAHDLHRTIFQHIVFNFRIWNKSDFAVRIGHIQYLATIIKDERRYCRKKYGVQFLLDVIRHCYSTSSSLNSDDMKTIRVSLLGLIKYYMTRDASRQEVFAVLGFLVSVKQEAMVGELLDMLLTVLDNKVSNDQIFLHFFEAGCSDLLYGIITNANFSTSLKHKTLKIIMLLLKSDRVYEKNKLRLRLQDVGIPGLTSFLQEQTMSMEMTALFLDFVLLVDKPFAYQGLMAFLQLIKNSDISVKLKVASKVLNILRERPSVAPAVAKQQSWQDSILCLLIKQSFDFAETEKEKDGSVGSADLATDAISGIDAVPFSTNQVTSDKEPSLVSSGEMCVFEFETRSLEETTQWSSEGEVSSLTDVQSELLNGDMIVGRSSSLSTEPNDAKSVQESYKEDIDDGKQKEVTLLKYVAAILATVFWRGIDGSDPPAWMERGKLFTCINLWALNNELFVSHVELKRRILEHAVQNATADLNSGSGQLIASHSENARELMRWLYDFVVVDPNKDHNKTLSVELLDGVFALLETLLVFDETPPVDAWAEMAHLGLSFLIACCASDSLEFCAIATPRLHTLVQMRSFANIDEACFILGSIDDIVSRVIDDKNRQWHYSFLITVLKALLDKIGPCTVIGISQHLRNLPCSQSGPSFFEEFQSYAKSNEWTTFVDQHIKPRMEKFVQVTLRPLPDAMNDFWNLCYEATMVGIHTRNREWGECKLKFQSLLLEPFKNRRLEETARYQQGLIQIRSQLLLVKRRWQQMCVTLMGSRGPWGEGSSHYHWKLAPHENFSRMRLKLEVNLNFNDHAEASRLRDNLGGPQQRASELDDLPMSLAMEAKVTKVQEDSLAEEDLNVVALLESVAPDLATKEKLVLKENCDLVTLMSVVKGRLEITTTQVYFFDCSPIHEHSDRLDFKWSLSQLREVHLRRYNLRRSALELFLVDQTNYFLNFTTKTRNQVYSRLIGLRPQNLFYHSSRTPTELLRASGLMQKWVTREISNFDYLMQLNKIAGRTYNDLSQYPVFPWILCDYASEELDLNDARMFRDLSKPIGVINPRKMHEVKAKYDEFEDSTGTFEKFHYGTHYSNSAGVLHYLVRMEPFTSLHIELQSGRFDVADRQFHSIPGTWRMLMESTNDVKELIPEFFYLPEFLINMNKFDLGGLQENSRAVNDVELPRWAKDPYDFIHKHRMALESEHVSTHLHEWIDLIFGYKQKGKEAVQALNVFFYCSYEGAVDLDSISDDFEREQLEKMINNFGQTPCQLLKDPHPLRLTSDEAKQRQMKESLRQPSIFIFLDQLKAFYIEVSLDSDPVIFTTIPRNQARSFIQQSLLDNLVTISRTGVVGVHGWLPHDKFIPHYFTFEKDPTLNNAKMRRKIGNTFQPGLRVDANLFVVTHDGRLLISGGHWDNSIRVYSLVRGRNVAQVVGHRDVVNCLAIDHFGLCLVSGSLDGTCCVWEIIQQGAVSLGLSEKPTQVLVGHNASVTCVTIMSELDVVASGAEDGSINMHSATDGILMRTLISPFPNTTVYNVSLSELGQLVAVYRQKGASVGERGGGEPAGNGSASSSTLGLRSHICVFSINGHRLAKESFSNRTTSVLVTGSHLVVGSQQGQLIFKELPGLQVVTSLSLHIPIMHLGVAPKETHILASLQDGKLIVVGLSPRNDK